MPRASLDMIKLKFLLIEFGLKKIKGFLQYDMQSNRDDVVIDNICYNI